MELGFMEMVVIALAIVVLFGPDKLPQIARDLGTGVRKMRGAMDDIKSEIMKETDNPVSEIKREIEKVKQAAKEYDPTENIKQEMKSLESSVSAKTSISEDKEVKPVIKPSEDETYEGPVSR